MGCVQCSANFLSAAEVLRSADIFSTGGAIQTKLLDKAGTETFQAPAAPWL